jgi:prevent-host-death family protein
VVMKVRTIAAARFKAECLSLIDAVAATGEELVITRRGKPVARLVPLAKTRPRSLKARARIVGDIVNFGEPEWIE